MTSATERPTRTSLTGPTARWALLLIAALLVGACGNDPKTVTEPGALDGAADADRLLGGPGDEPVELGAGDDENDVGEYDGAAAPFDIVLARKPVELILRFDKRVRAGDEIPVKIRARASEGGPVRGAVTIDFGDGTTETVDLARTAEFAHTFDEQGSYRMRILLVDSDGDRTRGSFRIRVAPPIRVAMNALPDGALRPGDPQTIRFVAIDLDSPETLVGGRLTVDYGDGTTEVLGGFTGDTRRSHTYEQEGDYVILLTLAATAGGTYTRSFGLSVLVNNTGDEIDMSIVHFVHTSPADWEVNSEVTDITINGADICIRHTMAGGWPVDDGSEGNPWVIAFIDGAWRAGTYEWLRPGQVCKAVTMDNLGEHVKQPPFLGWVPQPGDQLYFFVSTNARFGSTGPPEYRSNAKGKICCR